jgi:hypothetical protein
MGTLHLRRDLVVAVTMDEHKIVVLVILMVSIYVVNLYDVLVFEVVLTVAARALLLFEQPGFAWGEQRIATQPCAPVCPISVKW